MSSLQRLLLLLTFASSPALANVVEELSTLRLQTASATALPYGNRGLVRHQGHLYFANHLNTFSRTDGSSVEAVWAGMGVGYLCPAIAGATADDLYFSCVSGSGAAASPYFYEPQSPGNLYASSPTFYKGSIPNWDGFSYLYRRDSAGTVTQHWDSAQAYLARPL